MTMVSERMLLIGRELDNRFLSVEDMIDELEAKGSITFLGEGSEKEAYYYADEDVVIKVPHAEEDRQTRYELAFIEDFDVFTSDGGFDTESIKMVLPEMAGIKMYSKIARQEVPVIIMEFVVPAGDGLVISSITNTEVYISDSTITAEDYLRDDYGYDSDTAEYYQDTLRELAKALAEAFDTPTYHNCYLDLSTNFGNFGFNRNKDFKVLDFGWGLN